MITRFLTTFAFFSDHGLTDLAEDGEIRVANYIQLEDLDFLYCYCALAFIEPKPGKLQTVYKALKGIPAYLRHILNYALPFK